MQPQALIAVEGVAIDRTTSAYLLPLFEDDVTPQVDERGEEVLSEDYLRALCRVAEDRMRASGASPSASMSRKTRMTPPIAALVRA